MARKAFDKTPSFEDDLGIPTEEELVVTEEIEKKLYLQYEGVGAIRVTGVGVFTPDGVTDIHGNYYRGKNDLPISEEFATAFRTPAKGFKLIKK